MDITAADGKFLVGMLGIGGWEYEWNKKDGSLVFWGKRPYPLNVTTFRGDFIEAVDEAGTVVAEGGDGDWFYVEVTEKKTTLRFKKLAVPALTATEINKARVSKTITVVSQERHDDGPFCFGAGYEDGTLAAVIDSLTKIRDSIPKRYRAKARCEIDSESGYEGSHYASINVSYDRPETDAEVIERLTIESERARIEQRKDRANLAALKAKLGENAE